MYSSCKCVNTCECIQMSLHTFLCVQVGGALLDVLLKAVTFQADANDPESKPIRAFYHVYEFLGERKVGYIKVKGTCTSDLVPS